MQTTLFNKGLFIKQDYPVSSSHTIIIKASEDSEYWSQDIITTFIMLNLFFLAFRMVTVNRKRMQILHKIFHMFTVIL